MTTSTENRDEQVGAFFATRTDLLQRAVRQRVHGVGGELIEDACQVAWMTLLRRPDITLDGRGFSWLVIVAVREAWRLGSIERERPVGSFVSGLDPDEHERGELPKPTDADHSSTDAKALDHIEHLERFRALQGLKPAQREALYLKGLGYSYHEIMRLTGASYTAVNRRITEGRAALRAHLGEHSGPR